MKKKTILVAVINDVSSDQRIHKTATYLVKKGFNVIVRGRKLPNTFEVNRSYKIIHKKHWFNSKFLFYAEYNLRLFFFLICYKSNYILSNDLDTLPACFLASKIKRNKLVYDSHEYFTETPELEKRGFVKSIWLIIEKLLVPRLKNAYTVSESIAKIYTKKYKTPFGIIRNVPIQNASSYVKKSVSFPTNNKTLLYQGKLTKNRGLYQVIEALHYIKNVDLIIIGHGKEKHLLHKFVINKNLEKRVHFLGRIPYEELHNYTKKANLGLLLEEPVGDSFKYALPNKLFDYIICELPFIAYPLKEVERIVLKHKVGILIENHNPEHLAKKINEIIFDKKALLSIKNNQRKIKSEFSWEKESKLLDHYFS